VNPHLIKELSRILLPKSVLRNPHSTHPDKRMLSPLIGIETGSARLAAQMMPGKALPFDIRDWPDIVVEATNILNENHWFPVYTFIVGLPEETDDDIKQSLDLLHRLRKNKIVYVPSIFTPLEDTRTSAGHALKPRELSKLQWEFILTAWKQSREFGVVNEGSNRLWKLGTFAFYYLRGRWVHGPNFRYPAMRFAGVPEERLSGHLYLDWSKHGAARELPARKPRLIAKHRGRSIEELARLQDGQPFRASRRRLAGPALSESPCCVFPAAAGRYMIRKWAMGSANRFGYTGAVVPLRAQEGVLYRCQMQSEGVPS